MYYPVWMLVILLNLTYDQAAGAFLQAISAALATIPLTGGPIAMTAGLAGVKLAVGSKLLYYLGFFGKGAKKTSTPSPMATSFGQTVKPESRLRYTLPHRYSVPLPYMLAAGAAFRQPQLGMPLQGFPNSYSSQQLDAGQHSQGELMRLHGTRQDTGYEHLMPNSATYGIQNSYAQTGSNSEGGYSSSLPLQSAMNAESQWKDEASTEGNVQLDVPIEIPRKTSSVVDADTGGNESDIDSFFNFLGEMDDNMCISRLLCDIGADPSFLGEFSQNINSIISSLEVPTDSRANHYVSIMQEGREQKGGCAERFGHHCTDSAYEIVKSVAPTVNIPPNLEDLNV